MRKHVIICSLLSVCGIVCLWEGCGTPAPPADESPEAVTEETVDARGFDPLELPRDREVVPVQSPRNGVITGHQELVGTESVGTEEDSLSVGPENYTPAVDSVNNQAFRVQLFTSKLYGEAQQAVRVAEEIFDQPVVVDYEVPYFKVRVGSFADRETAEEYQQKAKGAGYTNAWVVMVNVGVREAAPLYDEADGVLLPVSPVLEDTVVTDDGRVEDPDR